MAEGDEETRRARSPVLAACAESEAMAAKKERERKERKGRQRKMRAGDVAKLVNRTGHVNNTWTVRIKQINAADHR